MTATNFSFLKDTSAEEFRHNEIEIMTGAIDAVATESARFPSIDSVVCDLEERWETFALVA
jgi:hypothetical protein